MRNQIELTVVLREVRAQFKLDWRGIHEFPHWRRVHRFGLQISMEREADFEVVELFSYLHDSCRIDDGMDPHHGPRAAEFARSLQGLVMDLSAPRLDLLCLAIRDHSNGKVSSNATIQTCWDSDRLDLWRVGIRPDPRFLSKVGAKILSQRFR